MEIETYNSQANVKKLSGKLRGTLLETMVTLLLHQLVIKAFILDTTIKLEPWLTMLVLMDNVVHLMDPIIEQKEIDTEADLIK